MSSFILKLIAIITMFIDHSNDVFIGHYTFLNILGRIAFPLFCFQIVVGFNHTRNVKKYLGRLFLFALISQVPYSFFEYYFFHDYFYLNVFFTLFLGLLSLVILNNKRLILPLRIILITLFMIIAQFCKTDYGALGILNIIIIYLFYPFEKDKNIRVNKTICYLLVTFEFSLLKGFTYMYQLPLKDLLLIGIFTFVSFILTLFYNGKKGPSFKYFFYIFYPLHLALFDIFLYFIK